MFKNPTLADKYITKRKQQFDGFLVHISRVYSSDIRTFIVVFNSTLYGTKHLIKFYMSF